MSKTQEIDGYLGEVRAASTAGGGQALATTLSATNGTIFLPLGTRWISLTTRNFATAVVAKVRFGPWADILWTNDGHKTFIDYSDAAQDAETTNDVVVTNLKTLANGGAIYVGSKVPFSGAWVDIDTVNAVTSVLTVNYWNGVAWTSIGKTDNTASAGATFAADGTVTWTVPQTRQPGALWVTDTLDHILTVAGIDPPKVLGNGRRTGVGASGGGEFRDGNRVFNEPQYWTQWVVSAQLTASTSFDKFGLQNRSAAYMELVSGQTFDEMIPEMRGGPIAWVECITDAGTGNLIVNVAALEKFE